MPEPVQGGGDEVDQEAGLAALYADMEAANLTPLWTQRSGLMPMVPSPAAVPAVWRWSTLYEIASRAGHLVPVGRGGERRAIALRNPGMPEHPYATPTLWAAIQYLGPFEVAPSHRHSQTAFRFVVEGEGVWTNVDGDAVAMRRGDLLLTPGWHWHEHQNTTGHAMAWIDGLDIPLVSMLDAGFFEFGPEQPTRSSHPARSRSERLWGHAGLRPLGSDLSAAPLVAYRWENTDAALTAQLELEAEGHVVTVDPGHAAVRFINPATGDDALTTIRTEMHRIAAGGSTATTKVVGSAVWQIFAGEAVVTVGDFTWTVGTGDLFVVPSWSNLTLATDTGFDAFCFADGPVYERLGLGRRDG
jgi:gentisate 1,2-dioxygenase